MAPTDRIEQQVAFVLEADKLKSILRRTPIADNSRLENSAEHSWHLALTALVFQEWAPAGSDTLHAIRLVVVHDLVEIDAGDTFAYDASANVGKAAREEAAAERIFGLVPPDQAVALRALWDEFEAQETPSARYANALDRLQPLLVNWQAGGGSWVKYSVQRRFVLKRMEPIRLWMPGVWPYVLGVIDRACEAGLIVADNTDTRP